MLHALESRFLDSCQTADVESPAPLELGLAMYFREHRLVDPPNLTDRSFNC